MTFKQGVPVLPGLGVPVLPGVCLDWKAWKIARSTKLINLGWEEGRTQKCSRFTGGLSPISEGSQMQFLRLNFCVF